MAQEHKDDVRESPVIPNVTCPRCHNGMRLALIEPAAMAASGVETLVFECVCGFTYRRANRPL
jgi:hypothetical protein